jgi:ribonuclease R
MSRKSKNKPNKVYLFEEVLSLFKKNSGKSYNYKQISSAMGLSSEDQRQQINIILSDLVKKELIEETERGKYRATTLTRRVITGKVDTTMSGSAYVVSDELEMMYTWHQNLLKAFYRVTQ